MTVDTSDPDRWTERPATDEGPEARAGQSLRQLDAPAEPSSARLARIKARVIAAEAAPRRTRARRLLVATSFALCCAGLGGGAHALFSRWQRSATQVTLESGSATVTSKRLRFRMRGQGQVLLPTADEATVRATSGELTFETQGAPMRVIAGRLEVGMGPSADLSVRVTDGRGERLPNEAPAPATDPAPAPPVPPPPAATPIPRPSRTGSTRAALPPPSTPPSPIEEAPTAVAPVPSAETLQPPLFDLPLAEASADEARVLLDALAKLRRDRDPRGALPLLEEHRARFPDSKLEREADLMRVEALLALGDHAGALERLDQVPLSRLPQARQFRLVRGELRAVAGRCKDAIADFALADAGNDDETAARALFGKATCELRLFQNDSARRSADVYLRRFPDGKNARDLREALGR